MYGYHGKALVIDVGTGQARWDPLPDDVLTAFIGGIGLVLILVAVVVAIFGPAFTPHDELKINGDALFRSPEGKFGAQHYGGTALPSW